MRKKILLITAFTLFVAATGWWFSRARPDPLLSAPLTATLLSAQPVPLGAPTLPIADPAAYAELHSPQLTAQEDVRIVEALVQNFQQSLMQTSALPPLGFNEEITRALTGANPLELAFIPSTHPAINPLGELCDRWGTPYSFHPVAADRIDVRSAGTDRRFFTPDDVLSRPADVTAD